MAEADVGKAVENAALEEQGIEQAVVEHAAAGIEEQHQIDGSDPVRRAGVFKYGEFARLTVFEELNILGLEIEDVGFVVDYFGRLRGEGQGGEE
jgi:hypothetical protein